jgi:hypothetical protein
MIKVYLAGKFENKLLINCFGEVLQGKYPIEFTNNWSSKKHRMTVQACAKEDYENIDKSDMVICNFPVLTGANSEMGYALGQKKYVIYVIPEIFWNGDLSPKWGETCPLAVGYLDHPYVINSSNEYEFTPQNVYDFDRGWVVHEVDDIVEILNLIYKQS